MDATCGAYEHLCDVLASAYEQQMSEEHCKHFALVHSTSGLTSNSDINCTSCAL